MSRFLFWLFPLLTSLGLLGIVLPAFGYMPALGFHSFSLQAWQQLFATPGLDTMVMTTVLVGIVATLLTLLLTFLFLVSAWQTRLWQWAERLQSPLLAIPHSALTIGAVFLLAPSGLISRLLAVPFDWSRPPDLLTVNDPWGLSLILALTLKEVPFLCLMAIAAVGQTPVARTIMGGRALGYSELQCWLKLIWPLLYPKLRLAVIIVLTFSLSVVDVSLIIGPQLPPLLPVQILQWQQDANPDTTLLTAAGALLLLALVVLCVVVWLMAEKLLGYILQPWLTAGYRGQQRSQFLPVARIVFSTHLLIAIACLLIVTIWSFSWRWPFPELLPSTLSLRIWSRYLPQLWQPLITTLQLAMTSATFGVLLSILSLESGLSLGGRNTITPRQRQLTTAFFYLPLLLPQLSFLMGIQTPLIMLNLDGQFWTVVATHLIYVFPYCYLGLAGVWQRYDQRYMQIGVLLSHSPMRSFWQIKLPMLLPAILTTLALGIAVSTSLYLPTLMAGGGRYQTLTTEAVALSSGGSRRLLSLYAVMQILLPLLFFTAARIAPTLLLQKSRQSQWSSSKTL